jgi:hypothetical protein
MLYFMLASLSTLVTTGCNDHQSAQEGTTQNLRPKGQGTLNDLEATVGFSFPTNTVLVNSGDGGGRDGSCGFYFWAMFSPSQIEMPAMHATGVKDYLNLPLPNTVKFVQGTMPNRKILQPQFAFSSEWETNGQTFQGTLIRSLNGDYLVVEQFRK